MQRKAVSKKKFCNVQNNLFRVWSFKGINTPSVKRQRQSHIMLVYGDAWEWVWDRFSSVTMYSNGIQSDAAAATDA